MAQIKWDSVEAPKVQPCCGLRHPLPWVHPGEHKCGNCGEVKGKRAYGYKATICKVCCKVMGIAS